MFNTEKSIWLNTLLAFAVLITLTNSAAAELPGTWVRVCHQSDEFADDTLLVAYENRINGVKYLKGFYELERKGDCKNLYIGGHITSYIGLFATVKESARAFDVRWGDWTDTTEQHCLNGTCTYSKDMYCLPRTWTDTHPESDVRNRFNIPISKEGDSRSDLECGTYRTANGKTLYLHSAAVKKFYVQPGTTEYILSDNKIDTTHVKFVNNSSDKIRMGQAVYNDGSFAGYGWYSIPAKKETRFRIKDNFFGHYNNNIYFFGVSENKEKYWHGSDHICLPDETEGLGTIIERSVSRGAEGRCPSGSSVHDAFSFRLFHGIKTVTISSNGDMSYDSVRKPAKGKSKLTVCSQENGERLDYNIIREKDRSDLSPALDTWWAEGWNDLRPGDRYCQTVELLRYNRPYDGEIYLFGKNSKRRWGKDGHICINYNSSSGAVADARAYPCKDGSVSERGIRLLIEPGENRYTFQKAEARNSSQVEFCNNTEVPIKVAYKTLEEDERYTHTGWVYLPAKDEDETENCVTPKTLWEDNIEYNGWIFVHAYGADLTWGHTDDANISEMRKRQSKTPVVIGLGSRLSPNSIDAIKSTDTTVSKSSETSASISTGTKIGNTAYSSNDKKNLGTSGTPADITAGDPMAEINVHDLHIKEVGSSIDVETRIGVCVKRRGSFKYQETEKGEDCPEDFEEATSLPIYVGPTASQNGTRVVFDYENANDAPETEVELCNYASQAGIKVALAYDKPENPADGDMYRRGGDVPKILSEGWFEIGYGDCVSWQEVMPIDYAGRYYQGNFYLYAKDTNRNVYFVGNERHCIDHGQETFEMESEKEGDNCEGGDAERAMMAMRTVNWNGFTQIRINALVKTRLRVHNNRDETVNIAYSFYSRENKNWESRGWVTVLPGAWMTEEIIPSKPNPIYEGDLFYFIEGDFYRTPDGVGNFCVERQDTRNDPGEFFRLSDADKMSCSGVNKQVTMKKIPAGAGELVNLTVN